MTPSENLKRLGLSLPPLSAPAGNYAHVTRSGNLLFLAGKGEGDHVGKVGRDVSIDQARESAAVTTLMLLSVIQRELGSIDQVRFLKVNGYVNSAPDFSEHPLVMDACTDLLVQLYGPQGLPARTSIGVAALPEQIPVEIEAIVEITGR